MALMHNEMTKEVARLISTNAIQWNLAFDLYKITKDCRENDQTQQSFPSDHTQGLITELAIRASLTSLVFDFSGAITLDPLLDGESPVFATKYEDFRLYVAEGKPDKSKEHPFCEIDLSASIDDLLVFFDVTLKANDFRKIEKLISKKRIRNLSGIAREYGHSDFGYVLVLPQEAERTHYPIFREFTENGGIIACLPNPKNLFLQEMYRAWKNTCTRSAETENNRNP